LGVLSAGIAHEINNPLAFIQSNVVALENNLAEMQGSEAVVAENRQILDETKEGFRRIGEVVQALRTFGRELPPGELPPYDLNQGIRTTLVMTRHEVGPDIVVDTDLADLPLIPARGPEINQVLLNLVMNAFQAVRLLPPSEVRLVLVRSRLDGQTVVAEVSNTGPAIPHRLREKIFEPFFSTKEPGAGMGLGLSLSWQIVVGRHGGELELLDREPVTFRLRLPLTQSATQSTK
jgi:signal transduction histidine kinase